MSFPHLSEVLKILDGALKSNSSMAINYAGLLADKLEKDGQREVSVRIRERLSRVSSAIAHAQDSSRLSEGLPIDNESRLNTIDVNIPSTTPIQLYLPSATRIRIEEFIKSCQNYDALKLANASSPLRVFLYGPPGTGKTQTAKWISQELDLPLLTVRCDTLISSLLGQTSKNIRKVFDYVEQRPCILFLDEMDALATARGNERDVGELQRVVISLLQNIDALGENTIIVAASNHEKLLDPAIWRRFPFLVPLPLPDVVLRIELWKAMLGSYAPDNLDWKYLAARSNAISGSLIEQVSLDAKRSAIMQGSAKVDISELYRRLSLSYAILNRLVFSTVNQEVKWLREWDEKQFSIRELSRLYGISTRKITQFIKGDIDEKGAAS
ncbi:MULTISPECIES: anti-phage ATPase IteA [Methylotenera]|uniref:anti-phage ATPase IteA n=1 Tax=Methylotenera TaxID=359407 RepID=UPI00036DDBF6|nr:MULTISPECIES: anti-phage ATPase IteA [Methylotenera]